MGFIQTYFRQHKWHRRMLTFGCMIVIGGALGLIFTPLTLDYLAIGKLTSSNEQTRRKAFARLYLRANQNPATLTRITDALDTENEEKFLALHRLLNRLDKFHSGDVPEIWIDRYKFIRLKKSFLPKTESKNLQENIERAKSGAFTRREILFDFITVRRDNIYVRKVLDFAATDKIPSVRKTAGMLAAQLEDDNTLGKLLSDRDPSVVAAAALDAGIAKRHELSEKVQQKFKRAMNEYLAPIPSGKNPERWKLQHIELISNTAYALEALKVNAYNKVLLKGLKILHERKDDILVDRLLRIVAKIDSEDARKVVGEILLSKRWDKTFPPASVIQGAAEMKLPQVRPIAMRVLSAAANKDPQVLMSQIIAAVNTARKLNILCRKELELIVRKLWYPGRSPMLVTAVRLLGIQITSDQLQPPGGPSREQCIKTLHEAAEYTKTLGDGDESEALTTPHASAAAAVSLWLINPSGEIYTVTEQKTAGSVIDMQISKTSGAYIQNATMSDNPLAGDYVSWNIAAAKLSQGFELGEKLLPAAGSKWKQHNPNVRAAGALLMSLTASNDKQRSEAILRITRRLDLERFYTLGACKCALLMLGDTKLLPEIREMLFVPDYSSRRVITSLLVAGDKSGLDWLLGNPNVLLETAAEIVIVDGLNSVLEVTAAELPLPSISGPNDVIMWEMEIMRRVWCINGGKFQVGL
jgi:hypothetical protein